jgi:hypothetical protein
MSEKKVVRRGVAIALGIVCILLIAGLGGAMAYYTVTINNKDNEVNSQKATISQLNATIEDQNNTINQSNTNVTNLQNQNTNLQNQVTGLQTQVNDLLNATDSLYYDLWYDEFGNVSFQSPSYNFSPPVSMYRALRIALKSGGWNASSLSDRIVEARIEYVEFYSTPSQGGVETLHEVTQPVEDYSPVQVNNTTYRYVWDVCVVGAPGVKTITVCYLVDAATGEMILHIAFPHF